MERQILNHPQKNAIDSIINALGQGVGGRYYVSMPVGMGSNTILQEVIKQRLHEEREILVVFNGRMLCL